MFPLAMNVGTGIPLPILPITSPNPNTPLELVPILFLTPKHHGLLLHLPQSQLPP